MSAAQPGQSSPRQSAGGSPHGPAGNEGYERSDLRAKTIAIALVLVGALTALGIVVSLGVFDLLTVRTARVTPPAPPAPPQAKGPETDLKREPPLQLNPIKDLAGMRAEEDKILTSYGWADREAGRVRMPIQRAMALLVERGLPPAANAASQKPTPAATQKAAQPVKPAPSKARKAR